MGNWTRNPEEKAAKAATRRSRYALKILDEPLLRECFTCDPVAGIVTWNIRPRHHFLSDRDCTAWNTRYANTPAGCVKYVRGGIVSHVAASVYKRTISVAHIMWILCAGEIPEGMSIDHKDCDPRNNRLSNLRLATASQQQWNKRKPKNNSLGYKGVSYHNRDGNYAAKIFVGGKMVYCKYFRTPEAAHAAYCEAAQKYYGEFARTA